MAGPGRRREEGLVIRKGPWIAEEDEILMDYVNKHGPRDWSSIQSKCLLPRTGKSCRLRWVNKLKPNLKTDVVFQLKLRKRSGCKFSAEEERTVIDLQAQFGNKWAKIATYLPGRTDNDVKNFWSTRQKRLARMLQTTPPPKSQKNQEKNPVLHEEATVQGPSLNPIPFQEESSEGQSSRSSYTGNSDIINMVQLPDSFNFETSLPPLECFEFETVEKNRNPYINLPITQFSQLPLDIPILPESQDLVAGGGNTNFLGMFACRETLDFDNPLRFPLGMQFSDLGDQLGIKQELDNLTTPKTYFGDFPADAFDYFETNPSLLEW